MTCSRRDLVEVIRPPEKGYQDRPADRALWGLSTLAFRGPNLETRAEYRFLRQIGADVVGMSTIPEIIVAAHSDLRAVGFSIVTDMCFPDALEPADVEKIIATANEAEPRLRTLVTGVLAREAKTT